MKIEEEEIEWSNRERDRDRKQEHR